MRNKSKAISALFSLTLAISSSFYIYIAFIPFHSVNISITVVWCPDEIAIRMSVIARELCFAAYILWLFQNNDDCESQVKVICTFKTFITDDLL